VSENGWSHFCKVLRAWTWLGIEQEECPDCGLAQLARKRQPKKEEDDDDDD